MLINHTFCLLINLNESFCILQAYDICVKRNLLKEQVFILGRMGNSKQALAVIINKLGDIEEVPHNFTISPFVRNFMYSVKSSDFTGYRICE